MTLEFLDLLLGDTITRFVFFPSLAALPLLFLGRAGARTVKLYALFVALVELALIAMFAVSHWGGGTMVARDATLTWLDFGSLKVLYEVGVDGISLPLVLLTGLLLPLVILGSWQGITKHWAGFAASMLLLTTGMLGALVALDLLVFYVFWEVMLIPMYLIIGIWGGDRRVYAAVKFFLFTMAGSLLMLLGILWMAWSYGELTGVWSFRYEDLLQLQFPLGQQLWLFAAFALAFAIKVPMFPFHTWLPDAHVEAPTGGSVILAGVLLKLGTYGFLRFAIPFFPQAATATRALGRRPGARRHRLRRPGRLGPDRHEEAGRLLLDRPSRLRHARPLRLQRDRLAGRPAPDGQPRPLDRRPLPSRRHAL